MRSRLSLCSIGSFYSPPHLKPRSYCLAGSFVCVIFYITCYNCNSDIIKSLFSVKPCNPAVGGPAKSQLVHEVDALGGDIGKVADLYVLSRLAPMMILFFKRN